MSLTHSQCEQTSPFNPSCRLTDGHGLFLLVTPSGGKLWRWKYRFEGKEKLMALGKFPEISLEQARLLHTKARQQLANGIDPMALRKRMKQQQKLMREFNRIFRYQANAWWTSWIKNICRCHPEMIRTTMDCPCESLAGETEGKEMDLQDLALVRRICNFNSQPAHERKHAAEQNHRKTEEN
jgi:hypothetical protein